MTKRLDADLTAAYVGAADLLGRYAAYVDNGTMEQLAELFGPSGVMQVHGGARYTGETGVIEFLTGSRASRKGTSFRLHHHVSSQFIEVQDQDHATARSYFMAVGLVDGPDHWGTYEDALERVEGTWYFAERKVSIQGATPTGWVGSGTATVKLER
jgi:hypothetical protein